MNLSDIISYWQSAELLQPQAVPALKKRDSLYMSFIQDIYKGQSVMPWHEGNQLCRQPLPKERVWSHLLYAHCYQAQIVDRELDEIFGADRVYKESPDMQVSLFAARFTDKGVLVSGSLVVSSAAWALGRFRAGENWKEGFYEEQEEARQIASEYLGGVVTAENLDRFVRKIISFLKLDNFFKPGFYSHRCKSNPVKKDSLEQEETPLNSFILDDLRAVSKSLSNGVTSKPLAAYLAISPPDDKSIDILADGQSDFVIDQLRPALYPMGCWPSVNDFGLVHSQQLAVNHIIGTLSNGAGLLSVNGPPGTGKTTLLRDVIAAVVTRRADVLASFSRASDVFGQDCMEQVEKVSGNKAQHSYHLHESLFGHEIVVASSNNGAVENVTLELPQRDKIDQSWLQDYDHFVDLSESLTGEPAWGLISAALGKKENRSRFANKFYWGAVDFLDVPEKDEPENSEDEPFAVDDNQFTFVDANDIDEYVDATDDFEGVEPAPKSKPMGFRKWLESKADIKRLPAENKHAWTEAVNRYKQAKQDVMDLRAEADKLDVRVKRLVEMRTQAGEKRPLLAQVKARRDEYVKLADDVRESDSSAAAQSVRSGIDAVSRHLRKRPNFLDNLLTLWGASRDWALELELLRKKLKLSEQDHEAVDARIKRMQHEMALRELKVTEVEADLHQLESQLSQSQSELIVHAEKYQAEHLVTWARTGVIGRGDDIELKEPWIIPGWHRARAKVFMEALNLHRVFFELEPGRTKGNISFAISLIQGEKYRNVSRAAVRSAWATLFMAVPVLSSTFASFARSFQSLDVGEIGWLLVDEAGQATPQLAVGALWRSRRAVMVGDPLQLKPIMTVSDQVLEHMRNVHGVDPHWIPTSQSAQALADRANPVGSMVGPAGMKRWVGLPLVVHRRCDRPMFEIANRIAYDGKMVYGTSTPSIEKETVASLTTGWIDVRGVSSGNWVASEGTALSTLLKRLASDGVPPDDISVITPFQDVRDQLKNKLRAPMVFGTIHTMQGKESAIVVLVLGGRSDSPGARDWVVSEPNLLNVAATRGKRRFYVIGDRADWGRRPMFCDVMDLLPKLDLTSAPAPTSAQSVGGT
jgi:hypothetical protein